MRVVDPPIDVLLRKLNEDAFPLEQIKTMGYIYHEKLSHPLLLEKLGQLAVTSDIFPRLKWLEGFSIADFALSLLYWLDTPDSLNMYQQIFPHLAESRKLRVMDLISRRVCDFL